MIDFEDRLGRIIDIEIDDTDAFAYHNGKRIGRIDTTGFREMDKTEDLPPQITGMFVDREYQTAGIGLELLRQLSEELGPLIPAAKNEGRGGQNTLTNEGLRLTRRAQKLGYIFEFDDERPPDDNL